MLTKEKHTRSSKFQVSWIGVRSIIKKFEETHTVENRGRNRKISKTLERKLVKKVSKEPSTKTLVNDLGLMSQQRQPLEACTGMDCKVADQEKLNFWRRDLQARPTFEGQPLEKLWPWTTIPVLSRNGWICSKSQNTCMGQNYRFFFYAKYH